MSPVWTLKRLVDVGGLEPPTPCLQIRFKTVLKLVEFCCFQVILVESFATTLLKSVESCGNLVQLQPQNYLQPSIFHPLLILANHRGQLGIPGSSDSGSACSWDFRTRNSETGAAV
jgi:hypothetical protein